MTEEKFLTIFEVTTILRLSRNTVYDLIHKGKLKAFRIDSKGRKGKYNRKPWRVKESDLAEFIMSGANHK